VCLQWVSYHGVLCLGAQLLQVTTAMNNAGLSAVHTTTWNVPSTHHLPQQLWPLVEHIRKLQ